MTGWDWRKPDHRSVMLHDEDRARGRFLFHAYDTNSQSACEPIVGLGLSAEDPNEGSEFCPKCMDIVRREPSPSAASQGSDTTEGDGRG